MTKQPAPYTTILPTILCQQPAVILHWLQTERATGNLPVEIVLDVLIELMSRQIAPTDSIPCAKCGAPVSIHAVYHGSCNIAEGYEVVASGELEVYKRAVIAMRKLNEFQDLRIEDYEPGCDCVMCGARLALDAVDKLEGK